MPEIVRNYEADLKVRDEIIMDMEKKLQLSAVALTRCINWIEPVMGAFGIKRKNPDGTPTSKVLVLEYAKTVLTKIGSGV